MHKYYCYMCNHQPAINYRENQSHVESEKTVTENWRYRRNSCMLLSLPAGNPNIVNNDIHHIEELIMRELTEKEMNLVAGGIARPIGENGASIINPFPLGSQSPESGGNGGGSSGGDIPQIVQDACGDKGASEVEVKKEGPSGSVSVGYTPPKKVTVEGSYDSGSTTVTVDCNE